MVMLHLWRSPILLLGPVCALRSWADEGTSLNTVRNINVILMLKVATIPEVAGISASTYFTTPKRRRNWNEHSSTPSHFVAHRVDSKPAALLLLLLLLFISMSYKYSVGLCVRSFTDAVRSLKSTSKCFSFLIWENWLKCPNAKYSTPIPFTNHFQAYPENSLLPCIFFLELVHHVFLQFNRGVAGEG